MRVPYLLIWFFILCSALTSCEKEEIAPPEEEETPWEFARRCGPSRTFFVDSDSELFDITVRVSLCDSGNVMKDSWKESYAEVDSLYTYITTYELANVDTFGGRWVFDAIRTGPVSALGDRLGAPYYRNFVGRDQVDGENTDLNVTCYLPGGEIYTTRPAGLQDQTATVSTAGNYSVATGYFTEIMPGESRVPNSVGYSLFGYMYKYEKDPEGYVAVDSIDVTINVLNWDIYHLQ